MPPFCAGTSLPVYAPGPGTELGRSPCTITPSHTLPVIDVRSVKRASRENIMTATAAASSAALPLAPVAATGSTSMLLRGVRAWL